MESDMDMKVKKEKPHKSEYAPLDIWSVYEKYE
jgi:hypothetical protein